MASPSDIDINMRDGEPMCRNQGKGVYARNKINNKAVRITVRAVPEISHPGYPRQTEHDIAAGGETRIGCERINDSAIRIKYEVIGVVERGQGPDQAKS